MTVFAQYAGAVLVSFSGLFAGAWLALSVKEEMKTGEKYFSLLQKAIYLAAIFVFFTHFKLAPFIMAIVYAVFIFSIWKKKMPDYYIFLAAIFFLLGQDSEKLLLISALTFLYGFPTGSLFVVHRKEKTLVPAFKHILIKYFWFVVVALAAQIAYSVFILKEFY